MAKEPVLKFKNDTDKASALEEFQNLKNQPGWKRLVEYYDRKIEWLQKVINGDIANEDGTSIIKNKEELDLWRAKRNMALQFRNLPDILMEFIEAAEGREVNLDPYEES